MSSIKPRTFQEHRANNRVPEEVATKRAKMLSHLEAARALASEVNDSTASLMIEFALTKLREDNWLEGARPRGKH
jgi:hypothetical protein